MSASPPPAAAPMAADLLGALARVAAAPTADGAATLACEAVVAQGGYGRAVYVAALPGGLVFGSAGMPPEERDALRAQMGLFGPVERSTNRFHALERHRFDPDLDVAFVPAERRGALPPVLLAAPVGEGSAGERWEAGDELVLLPHSEQGASLGTLALSAPADGRRPTAAAGAALRTLLDFARAVGALLRARDQALEQGREHSRQVLAHVQSLTTVADVNGLLDRIAEICARLAGFRVAVLTAHMEDGPHVGTWNIPADEREAFQRSSRGSTVESTADKRARIRALAFPGTGISYVPHDVPLSRSKAFAPGKPQPGGSWHPDDRLFVLLKTTQGRDIGVLSLDEPVDGRAPRAESLGPLRVAERFLDLGGALLETRLLQAQVERTQRLEAVGTLVAGVAHDFNNMLGAIMGYASLLRMQLPEGSPLLPTARSLDDACERAAGLTRRLRALTQNAPPERRPLDVGALIGDVARTARDTFDPRQRVETDLAPGLPPVLGDEGTLTRALMNLCINARDAQPDGGRIVLRAREETGEAGRCVTIDVEDEGPGLSPQARQHLFEPFFTTKARGKGTGLGLFGAWSAARAHGGALEAPEHGGKGALFRMRLPAAELAAASRAQTASGAGRRARVLVVEDESALQDLIGRGVELLGHQVESAWDGQQAIDVLEQRAQEFDLVLLDMLLPRRTGTEVFRALRAVRTDLPVILSSGYVEEALMEPDIAAGVAATLPKPWTLPQLQEAVQRVLSRLS